MSKGTTSKLIKLGVMMSFFVGIYLVTGISDFLYDKKVNALSDSSVSYKQSDRALSNRESNIKKSVTKTSNLGLVKASARHFQPDSKQLTQ